MPPLSAIKFSLRRSLRDHPVRWAAVVLVVSAVVLFVAHNRNTERQWQHYLATARARGMAMIVQEWTSRPAVLDEQNLAALPIWRTIAQWDDAHRLPMSNYHRQFARGKRPKGPLHTSLREFREGMIMRGWLTVGEAVGSEGEIVVRGLRRFESYFAALDQAADRPWVQFPAVTVDDDGQAAADRSNAASFFMRAVRVRIAALLAAGRSAEAYAALSGAWALCRVEEASGTSTAWWGAMNLERQVLHLIWEGLDWDLWDDAQLMGIEEKLASLATLARFQQALRAERALYNDFFERSMKARDPEGFFNPHESKDAMRMARVLAWQSAWWRKNQLEMNQWMDVQEASLRPVEQRWHAPIPWSHDRSLHQFIFSNLLLARGIIWPARWEIDRTLFHHSRIRLAGLACALERFRRGQGGYPETLQQLVPAFLSELPHEAITGEPFQYARSASEGYILYSTALDGKDDGGSPDTKNGTEKDASADSLDWRWWAPRRK